MDICITVGGTPIVLPLSSILLNLGKITNPVGKCANLVQVGVRVTFPRVSSSLIDLDLSGYDYQPSG